MNPLPPDVASLYAGKRALVTGGLGFVGANLAHALVALGAEVRIFDGEIPDTGANRANIAGIEHRVDLHAGDLRDAAAAERAAEGADFVFNLAGSVSHVDSMQRPLRDLALNAEAALSMLEAVRRKAPEARVVFTGTRSQYGRIVRSPVDEEHPRLPTDTNGVAKEAAEQYHFVYHRAYGLKACSLRLTNTYGPRHLMRHARQGFLNWFVRQAMDGETIRIYGDGLQRRELCHVDDAVEALLLAAGSDATPGEAYNLGGDNLTLRECAETIVRVVGRGACELAPWPGDRKAIEIGSFVSDTSKIRKTLGWEPRTRFEDGIRKTVDYYDSRKGAYW